MVEGLGTAFWGLVGAGLFGAIVSILSTRESRNKRYDDSRAADMVRMAGEVTAAKKETEEHRKRANDLEGLNDQLRRDLLDRDLELARTKDALGRATDEIGRLKT